MLSANPQYLPYQQDTVWKLPLLIVGGLAFSTTLLFWLTDIDIYVAELFYSPPPAIAPWPQESAPIWRFFYYAAPIFTMLFALGAIIIIPLTIMRNLYWQRHALYILLTLAIGPGLLVNLVFKDHIGRPRPRQIEAFGGNFNYLPPLAIGNSSAEKSFPAGHASVGFSFCVLWFLWRRRRPRFALVVLCLSIILGLMMGVGRMASGAHFLSDVLWAGYISFFTALALYHFVLRIPDYEHKLLVQAQAGANNIENSNANNSWLIILYVGIGLAILGGALLAYPVNENISYQLPPAWLPLSTKNIYLDLHQANAYLTIYLDADVNAAPLLVSGQVRGFGLPTYRIDNRAHVDKPQDSLVYKFKQRGFFTELTTSLSIHINSYNLNKLSVRLDSGNIQIIANKAIINKLPHLDVQTNHGLLLPIEYYQ